MSLSRIRVADVRRRLANLSPHQLEGEHSARAAVAILLDEAAEGTRILLIHRAEREGDPWSGHMAFPGGFQGRGETDLYHTAVRETREEVGVDIAQHGEYIGALDDVRAVSDRALDLVIRPFVCALTSPVSLRPECREVQEAVWVPLAALEEPDATGVHRWHRNGHVVEYPAFIYRGFTIWGLTYRMLLGLLKLVS